MTPASMSHDLKNFLEFWKLLCPCSRIWIYKDLCLALFYLHCFRPSIVFSPPDNTKADYRKLWQIYKNLGRICPLPAFNFYATIFVQNWNDSCTMVSEVTTEVHSTRNPKNNQTPVYRQYLYNTTELLTYSL